jgi:hypothetical protein
LEHSRAAAQPPLDAAASGFSLFSFIALPNYKTLTRSILPLVFLFFATSAVTAVSAGKRPPNIVLLDADEIGFGAPRDGAARASYGNRAKSAFTSFIVKIQVAVSIQGVRAVRPRIGSP